MSILLQVNNLEMAYGTQTILTGASLTVAARQKVAVVGRNGAGKSTLFRLIVGEEEAIAGEIMLSSEARIGYLTQHSPFEEGETVMNYLLRHSGQDSWVCAKIAAQFQIKNEHFDLEVLSLAGGYQMRVKLSAMLAREPNLLLLDEPTNYLDLSTLLLLEQFLQKYRGAFMLISHDREFIKKTCQQTLEIEQGKTILFPQPLEEYLAYKQKTVETVQNTNKRILQEKERLQTFVDRFKAKASKAAQAKSKQKQIDKMETIELAHPLKTTKIHLPRIPLKKGIILTVEDLSIGYPEKTVARRINFDISRGEKIAVVGDNGQGKTTLLKTIAGELAALAGKYRWSAGTRLGYYAQHTPARLNETLSVKEYLLANGPGLTHEEIFEMAGNFLFKDEGLKKAISVLSGGEKARLCLATLLLQKNDVLLLDEPTNHLDFETVEALAAALRASNATVFFVSHNRAFVETLATGIVEVKNGQASRYHHDYENYVYHMRRALEQEMGTGSAGNGSSIVSRSPSTASVGAAHSTQTPSEIRQQLKKAKNKINSLETVMKKLAEEKKQILAWFEAHPHDYDSEKGARIGAIATELEAAEGQWMEVQEQIELLSEGV